ncbi:MAG: hypothetical protein JWO39_2928 [Gemmatimonadetes bacterium]|jgi:hypothetical protein|nr:hypothetical protein [Gemmatimonadota bacterium]
MLHWVTDLIDNNGCAIDIEIALIAAHRTRSESGVARSAHRHRARVRGAAYGRHAQALRCILPLTPKVQAGLRELEIEVAITSMLSRRQ